MRMILLPMLLLAAAISRTGGDVLRTEQDETVQQLIDWFIAKGGYIHPQVQVRRWDVSDPDSYYGVFVDESASTIKKDDLLITMPVSAKLQLEEKLMDGYYTETLCDLAWLLKREYELDEKSEYAPYIKYIKQLSKNQLPVMWSEAGKALLIKVQGDVDMTGFTRESETGEHMVNWINETFEGDSCLFDNETNQILDHFYLAMATQRGYDFALFPIYDMINHHNGNVNTETRPSIFDEDGFGIYALRDIEKGEELFYSYHDCPDCRDCQEPECDSTLTYWGTPEMLRDFGFVEPYPHRFHVEEVDEDFTLLIEKNPDEDNYFDVTCVDRICPSLSYAQRQVDRLQKMFETDILPAKDTLPPHEFYNIDLYHDALYTAFASFLVSFDEDDFDENGDFFNNEEEDEDEEDEEEENTTTTTRSSGVTETEVKTEL